MSYLQFGGMSLHDILIRLVVLNLVTNISYAQHLHGYQVNSHSTDMRKISCDVQYPDDAVKGVRKRIDIRTYQLPLPQPRSTHDFVSPGTSARTSCIGGAYLPMTSMNMICCLSVKDLRRKGVCDHKIIHLICPTLPRPQVVDKPLNSC